MTLFRQIALLVSVTFSVLVAGLSLVTLHQTRGQLQANFALHARESAMTLALAIADEAARHDAQALQNSLDGWLARGHFSSVEMTWLNGQRVRASKPDLPGDGVP
ncbi:MAG TPA: LapD/MoxY N-terminal periplasmic domain-containing protein, partial [Pseudomonadales bacterium]|nr:LapD/MoxY N-terminal periplasmic domain-containing protein [Pseudomonadales bacterium]